MKYVEKENVTIELLDDKKTPDDIFFFRELAWRIVNNMPEADLRKLFHCDKFHPFSQENERKLEDDQTEDWEKHKIMWFRERYLSQFTVSITV